MFPLLVVIGACFSQFLKQLQLQVDFFFIKIFRVIDFFYFSKHQISTFFIIYCFFLNFFCIVNQIIKRYFNSSCYSFNFVDINLILHIIINHHFINCLIKFNLTTLFNHINHFSNLITIINFTTTSHLITADFISED
jgi:hypothetical protein